MNTIYLEGFGLRGSRSRVAVQKSRRFALYSHVDSHGPAEIAYEIDNIAVENHVVTVGGLNGVAVVEHLFSALYGMDLYNVRIDVHGKEMPFFDGSSVQLVQALQKLKSDYVPGIRLADSIQVNDAGGSICYTPSAQDELVVEMSLTHPYIDRQDLSVRITPLNYIGDIAPARTFVFTDEFDGRLKELPPYGIGITRKGVYSKTPLRFPDEPVRHKILDLLGELYILRRPIFGKITGRNTSHRLNLQFMRKLLSAVREND
jgi:UDP-3-O-[3-hydroxymyristoyl] N-acetylglucosamine deacetylase